MQGYREANWPGRRRASTPRDVHRYIEHACMSWGKHVWTCVDRPSGHSSSYRGGRVKAASGLPAKVGTTRLLCGVVGRDGLGFWSQYISLWRSEDRRWSTREGWHDSPVVRGGWPGWTTSSHSTSRYGEVKTAGGLPAKVGTTRLSCGVGGQAGRPLVIARLAMEK
ncbi:hypothetical protein CDL15_Pgr023270 [Punica granatum]|uniref:Uncharacterized protein n=1 Tax=Punica granatum TaxID=22663 RepID=A0A218WHU2_PUNGR|nr:hypothetical protein CDL15_Pgr023270 [Punica granatum]